MKSYKYRQKKLKNIKERDREMEKIGKQLVNISTSLNNIIQKPELIKEKFDKESTLTTAKLRVYQSIFNKKKLFIVIR